MTEKTDKKPLQILKERVGPVPQELRDKVKEHAAIKTKIRKALKDGAMTVPEIAEATEIPSGTVLWHVMSMKKYGKVAEAEQSGDYMKYKLTEEK
jgi:predicted transcriptional regulator